MLVINWRFAIPFTLIIYFLIILFLPFSTIYATFFLFLLIAFWSRLPGVGIPHPFFLIYCMDLVDVFTVIIAINLSGVEAAIFSLLANLLSRSVGVFPPWSAVMSDSMSMAVTSLLIPFIHVLFGGNILITITVFTLVRALLWVPFDMLTSYFWKAGIVQYVIEMLISITALIFINGFYAGIFGGFFDALLKGSLSFSWPLFIFASLVIGLAYTLTWKKSDSSLLKNVGKRLLAKKKAIPKHNHFVTNSKDAFEKVYK